MVWVYDLTIILISDFIKSTILYHKVSVTNIVIK